MPELATAWITLAVSANNMQRDIRRELNKIDDGSAKAVGRKIGKDLEQGVGVGADGAAGQVKARFSERLGTQVGSVVGRGIGAGIKLGVAGAAGAAALAVGGIGIALSKGFDRLQSIDQAKFKLQALGNDAATTAKIMDNALASVKGTAFGLQDAATAAASAVAAGISPGQDLTKYLSGVGDAAAVAGTNFTDMGSIFNKIQTSNKAYTDDLQQLSDRGLPIFKWLQDEYGVTSEALSKMVQDGEVDAKHFQDAIDKNIGGAAQKMGQSFDGAVDNMQASVARLGANFITAILGGDPADALGGPTQAITNLTAKFDEIGIWVTAHRGEIHGFFVDVKNVANDVGGAIRNITTWLVENKGAAEILAGAFVGWKVLTTVTGVVTSLQTMSTLLRVTLPADAAVGGAGIIAGLGPAAAFIASIAAAYQGIDALKNFAVDKAKDGDRTWGNLIFGPKLFDDVNPPDPGQVDTGTPKGPLPTGPSVLPGVPSTSPFDPNPLPFPLPRKASGGPVFGAGTATSDSIPALLSNNEHVWTAAEVDAVGGQGAMYRLRAMARSGMLGLRRGGIPMGLPLETDDGHPRKNPGPGTRTRNRKPGNNPNEISVPDWSQPGQGWGGAPDWWWDRPIDPNDVLFPDRWGQMPWGKHPLDKGAKRVQGLGFAGGGGVGDLPTGPGDFVVEPNNVMSALQFAQSVSGGQYSYGGAGPTLFDCSGYMSAIYGIVTGKSAPTGQRFFTTESDFSKLGFLPGYDANSPFNIGVHNGGGGMNSHMAGTLAGVNVESGGGHGGTLFGDGAAGALDPQFEKKYHLAGQTLTKAFSNSLGTGAQDEADKQLADSKSGKSGSGFDGNGLGQSIFGGLLESIGLDGSVFSNPFEWPNVKSLMAGLNFGGSLLKGVMGGGQDQGDQGMDLAGGGGGGFGLPNFTEFLKPMGPQAINPIDPNTTRHGQGNGASPGPTFNVTATGMDPKAVVDKQQHAYYQAYRGSGLPAVRPA